jgi:hypothetical protein
VRTASIGRNGRRLVVAIATVAVLLSPLAATSEVMADDPAATFTTAPTPTLASQPTVSVGSIATVGVWVPTPDSFQYQWNLDGQPIARATGYKYLPLASQMGSQLSFSVTAIKAGYVTQTVTSVPQTVLGQLVTSGVKVDGVPKPGDEVTANPGTWSAPDVSLSYQWTADGVPIPDATDPGYTLTEDQAGTLLQVQVTGSKTGYATTTITSPAVRVTHDYVITYGFSLQGAPAVGSTLSILGTPQSYPQASAYTYQWQRDGQDIDGATDPTYTIQTADIGHKITLGLTALLDGFLPGTVISAPTAVILAPFDAVTQPHITGAPVVGGPLTAVVPAWTPAATSYQYEWFVNGVEQPSATTSTFTPTDPAFLGQTVTVQVTGGSATRARTLSPLSAATAPIGTNPFRLSKVTIGTVELNKTIVPKLPVLPAGVPIHYQWTANGVAIPGATARTYKPATAYYGKTIRFKAAISGTGYTSSSATSNGEVAHKGHLTIGGVLIKGTVRVGSKLTADPVGYGPGKVHFKYEWWSTRGTWTLVSKSSTYTVSSKDYGHTLTVFLQGSETHFYSMNYWLGDHTAKVAKGVLTAKSIPTITGTVRVGSKLTAHAGKLSPSATSHRYQWYSQTSASATPVAIPHATSSKYTIAAGQLGHILTVRVAAGRHNYTSLTTRSHATVSVRPR